MSEPEVLDVERTGPANPFASAPVVAAPQQASAQAVIAREVGEVHAGLVIAKSYPRDQKSAVDRILMACARPGLASKAVYEYARGGNEITGPSIRLAEVLAREWGNVFAGVIELSRASGVSECMAFAWDLETNYREERRFQVKHWRDTKRGGYQLTDERDIYEAIANAGARRKRACILALIPGDVQESALEQCHETLAAKVDTSPERVAKMVEAFGKYQVTAGMIEKRIQRRLDTITPAQMLWLGRIFTSLADGVGTVGDWFEAEPKAPVETTGNATPPATRTEAVKQQLRKNVEAEAPAPHDTTPATDAPGQPEEAGADRNGDELFGQDRPASRELTPEEQERMRRAKERGPRGRRGQ